MSTIYNKIIANGKTLMDISSDTVDAEHLMQGYTAHDASGNQIVGTASGGGITPTGTIDIDDEGIYDVTNYASADVAIDYSDKVRELTLVINRIDTTNAAAVSIFGSFGSSINFSDGIKEITKVCSIGAGESTASQIIYIPKSRPIIVLGVSSSSGGNFSVGIDSSYGEVIDVPHILGASNSMFTKTIYIKTATPDQFTITITLNSQEAYPETVVTNALSVTTNGTYQATAGTAYSSVAVNVPSSTPTLQSKTATPSETAQTITADSGYDGLSSVAVGAISSTYVGSGVTRQAAKTVTPTESEQTAVASGVYTTGIVKVGAISSTYVGSGIDQRDETDLTASGATVTVPAGYYAEQETKSVTTTGHLDPTIAVSSVGLITATHIQNAGYVNAGTTTKTYQLSTQAAATITPTTSSQTAVASGKYTTGAVTVAAMPSGSAGTPSASKGTVSNHSITVTPSVTNTTGYIEGGTKYGSGVTVAASELVSGSQTITANGTVNVTNLASVTVDIDFSTVTASTSDPSGGSDGDIWIKTS